MTNSENNDNLSDLDLDASTNKIINSLKIDYNVHQQKINRLQQYFHREAYEYVDIVSDLNEPLDQSLIYEFCKNQLNDTNIFNILHDIMLKQSRHKVSNKKVNVEFIQNGTNRNYRRSLINTNIKQIQYEDPDAEIVQKKENNEEKQDDESIKYDQKYTLQFEIKWNNIIHAIKQELYKAIGDTIDEIINDKENEIKQNDLTDDTVNKVLNILSETKKTLSKEEYSYLNDLIKRAKQFKPYTKDLSVTDKRITTRRFPYRYDFDRKGLLFCIGTKGLLQSSFYTNPADAKLVEVLSSPLKDNAKTRTLVGRRDEECTTISKKGAFMTLNLKNIKIRLTRYTLRYYSWDSGAPRNWELQGSNDGKLWKLIKNHVNDKSLKKRGDTFTWKIAKCKHYYSYFRLISTGYNGRDYSLSISGLELYGDAYGDDSIINTDLHYKYPQLTVSLLQDIYDVHRSFRYTHYHYDDYKEDKYIKDVMNNIYLEQPGIYKRFNFDPTYIVNDDLLSIFQYVFAVSLYINNKMNSIKDNKYEIKLFVIGYSVESVFDNKLIFPYNIGNVDDYLKDNNCIYVKNEIDQNDIRDISKIVKTIENTRETQKQIVADNNEKNRNNLLIIVDRRGEEEDILYITEYDKFNHLTALTHNYFVGMTFNILYGVDISSYLTYGINEKLRFYAEQLTSIIPRLFKKPEITDYQYISLLYSSFYKYGFCLNLNTNINFNTYYKRITDVEHVSVNYNRKYIKYQSMEEDDDNDVDYSNEDEQKTKTEHSEQDTKSNECDISNNLELEQCIYIEHIVKSLKLFKIYNHRIRDENKDQFNLNFLSKCYDHIISAHSFCLNQNERVKIQKFVANIIGPCSSKTACFVLNEHASRRRENRRYRKRGINIDARTEILSSTLNSLHSYLVHTDAELFRLRDEEIDPGLRFSTVQDGLNDNNDDKKKEDDDDKIHVDQLNIFLRNNDINDRALTKFYPQYSWQ